MGFGLPRGMIVFLATATTLSVVTVANRSLNGGVGGGRLPKEFTVGDDKGWNFAAADYSAWAAKNAPFYVNDTLSEMPIYFNSYPQLSSIFFIEIKKVIKILVIEIRTKLRVYNKFIRK